MNCARLRAAVLVCFICPQGWADPGAPSRPDRAADSPAPAVFTVTPAGAGPQLVRFSIPLPRSAAGAGEGIGGSDSGMLVSADGQSVEASWRPLTFYPGRAGSGRSVRRGLLTFPFTFKDQRPVRFTLSPGPRADQAPRLPVAVTWERGGVTVAYASGPALRTTMIAPEMQAPGDPKVETVESGRHYLWQRLRFDDPQWPRVIEVRIDARGTVALIAHLQRNIPDDGFAPDFGWELTSNGTGRFAGDPARTSSGSSTAIHRLEAGRPLALLLGDDAWRIYHPAAPLKRRGYGELQPDEAGIRYRYLRCTASERVPMQQAAWRRAEIVIAPADQAMLTPTLASPHVTSLEPGVWDELYGSGPPLKLPPDSPLSDLLRYHHDAIVRSVAVGDDWGNITFYNDNQPAGAVYGMNRLNHCPPIFLEGYVTSDRRLIEAALAWCDNFYDLSIWWGPGKTGGTRYNNAVRTGRTPPGDPQTFMWRSNNSVHFCTKGYDSFLLAYEETGDPRMKEALDAQVAYAVEYVHTDQGECRNVGDVRDFLRLYEWTGESRFLDQALRLFRELRTKLSPGDLFSQNGGQILPDPPYIEEDQVGLKNPFAKPYIIGYALAGLPDLVRYAPEEAKLQSVVKAVADFLAESQDPVGGWRYPHPRSSSVSLGQAMEHAWQVMQAAEQLGPQDRYLDTIERVLRQRLHGWMRSGRMLSGLGGWEVATGRVKEARELYDLYKRPADRDPTRDYDAGAVATGSAPPEGIVYLPEILRYYLAHRPAARLLEPPRDDEPLARVLRRIPAVAGPQTRGVQGVLPVFTEQAAARLTFPMSWLSGRYNDFDAWRREARAKAMECLLAAPPPAPFEPQVISEQDRGSYMARKVVFNLTADSRVLGFLLVPKSKGPHPAVLLLHDHGAKFDIGKEKVIETWDDPGERPASARAWVEKCYGGRFIGDELAKRGYVCFATDALNWSDRGGAGYDGQQALASNLLHLGMSLAGVIAHEDLRAAEFLAGLPEVDPARIGAMGLSMGSFRTWQVAALSDRIAAGVAVCWMATNRGLMVHGNNQTRGQSAFTMTHPGRFNYLDYPDVASLACPKPMLFYNGRKDGLFPVACVEDAYATMRKVWDSQNAGDRLVTKLWDVPHVFNTAMQDEAFGWLDRQLRSGK